ncbi:unnamed protein product, partial [Urochloa humidicola]
APAALGLLLLASHGFVVDGARRLEDGAPAACLPSSSLLQIWTELTATRLPAHHARDGRRSWQRSQPDPRSSRSGARGLCGWVRWARMAKQRGGRMELRRRPVTREEGLPTFFPLPVLQPRREIHATSASARRLRGGVTLAAEAGRRSWLGMARATPGGGAMLVVKLESSEDGGAGGE